MTDRRSGRKLSNQDRRSGKWDRRAWVQAPGTPDPYKARPDRRVDAEFRNGWQVLFDAALEKFRSKKRYEEIEGAFSCTSPEIWAIEAGIRAAYRALKGETWQMSRDR